MRKEYTLGVQNNSFSVSLPFQPKIIIILNNTSNPVYLNRSTQIPSATFHDYTVLGAVNGQPGNLQMPTNSQDFSGFLPLTPTLTDTTQTVTFIFIGQAFPYRNFMEYVLNTLTPKKK